MTNLATQRKPTNWRALTKPQVAQLTRALRDTLYPRNRAETRVVSNLWNKGYLDGGFGSGFHLTSNGLAVLRDYRSVQYANHGSMASLKDLEEVEAFDDAVQS